MKSITILFIVLLSNINLYSNQIYISTNGNDNFGNGTINSPFFSIQFVLDNKSIAGDELILREGKYLSNEINIRTNNITIKSYQNEFAKIIAPINIDSITYCIAFKNPEINFGLLERLDISGGYFYGIFFNTNWDDGEIYSNRRGVRNVTLLNCRIHDTGRDCIKITPACSDIKIIGCEIYNSGVGPSNDPTNPDPYSHNAEGIDNVNSPRMIVGDCYFHDISTNGIYAKGGAEDCLIENNLIMNTGDGGIFMGFDTDDEWYNPETNPKRYDNIRGVARNNFIINTGSAGIGFWGAKDCKVYNNTIITPTKTFFSPLFINHNEIYPDANPEPKYKTACEGLFIKNNIFVDLSPNTDDDLTIEVREAALTGNNDIDNNLYYKVSGKIKVRYLGNDISFEDWQNKNGYDVNSIESNPMLDSNFHLLSNSICINKGALIQGLLKDYDGSNRSDKPDLGADEFTLNLNLKIPPKKGTIGTGGENSKVVSMINEFKTKFYKILELK